jgi:hypothetical protein
MFLFSRRRTGVVSASMLRPPRKYGHLCDGFFKEDGIYFERIGQVDPFRVLVGILSEGAKVQDRNIQLKQCLLGKTIEIAPSGEVLPHGADFVCAALESAIAEIGNPFEEGPDFQVDSVISFCFFTDLFGHAPHGRLLFVPVPVRPVGIPGRQEPDDPERRLKAAGIGEMFDGREGALPFVGTQATGGIGLLEGGPEFIL